MKIILAILCSALLLTGCKTGDDKTDPVNLFDLMNELTIIADKADIAGNKINTNTNTVDCDINVRNNTDRTLSVMVKKEVISNTPANIAEINKFCWNDTEVGCVGAGVMSANAQVKSKSITLFTGDVELRTLPVGKTEVKIKYTFTEKITNFSRSVTATYTYTKNE